MTKVRLLDAVNRIVLRLITSLVLTWVAIYWFSTGGPAASSRIYFEVTKEGQVDDSPSIPQGISFFPKDLVLYPRS